MAFGEEIISKKFIKPSSPTTNTNRNFKISFLDQIAPPVYIPLVFFYQNSEFNFNNHAEVSEFLQQSLSQTLTLYYPLAGKLLENYYIDCDDSGVEFVETRVHACLEQFRSDPKMEELRQLSPVDSTAHTNDTLLFVKLSFFDCGGFSIGACWSHKIGDVSSFATFMNVWAATCRGETKETRPFLDLANRFPPRESAIDYFFEEKEKIVTKRLLFDNEMMEKIRKEEADRSKLKNPTRVEAISSFLWKIFIEAIKTKRDPKKTSFVAYHAVNLRPRTVPLLPDSTFGNCYVGAMAYSSGDGGGDLVSKLRAAIKLVDNDYIKNVVTDEKYMRVLDDAGQSFNTGETVLCSFSSWWRFPLYDVDYGWGKPARVCNVMQPYKNLVILMSNPSADGIEAWVNIPEDFSEIFELCYHKLLST